jgi:hypothetical protein
VAGAGSVTREWTSGSVTFERLDRRYGTWGLAPTERGAPLFRQWRADAVDTRALGVGGRGSEKREARRAWAGPGRKRGGPSPDE